MSVVLVLVVGLALGHILGRAWILWLPAVAAAGYVATSLVGRLGHPDNPLLFVLLVAELGLSSGLLSRRLRRLRA